LLLLYVFKRLEVEYRVGPINDCLRNTMHRSIGELEGNRSIGTPDTDVEVSLKKGIMVAYLVRLREAMYSR
jgi:hypothetical protein